MSKQKIPLRAVLAEINQDVQDGKPYYFSIVYVKATTGQIGSKHRVRKSGSTQATKSEGKFKYNLKEKGILLLYNDVTAEHFSIKISHLLEYNGMEVFH